MPNYYVITGFNSNGIAMAGGAGGLLAEWIINGTPSMDTWAVSIKRLLPEHNSRIFLQERVKEVEG